MKRLLIALLIAASSASMVISDAQAKRLGGGGSFGRQSSGISRQATPPAPPSNPSQAGHNANQAANPAKSPTNPGAAAARPAGPWRNILGGALLGLGLGALLSHLGIGGALANIIGAILAVGLIVLAVMLLVRLFRGKNTSSQARGQPAYAGSYDDPGNQLTRRTTEISSRLGPQARSAAPLAQFQTEPTLAPQPLGNECRGVPADFDVEGFLRNAKTYFIRLQHAWDRGDVSDIREFASPEMFGQLRLQLQERGTSPNLTDVVWLDAELLGIDTTDKDYLASVRFYGMIKESEQSPAAPFSEVWNLAKPVSGQGGWVLAGIEQLA